MSYIPIENRILETQVFKKSLTHPKKYNKNIECYKCVLSKIKAQRKVDFTF